VGARDAVASATAAAPGHAATRAVVVIINVIDQSKVKGGRRRTPRA
jgi:hypothetical protein